MPTRMMRDLARASGGGEHAGSRHGAEVAGGSREGLGRGKVAQVVCVVEQKSGERVPGPGGALFRRRSAAISGVLVWEAVRIDQLEQDVPPERVCAGDGEGGVTGRRDADERERVALAQDAELQFGREGRERGSRVAV